MTVAKVNFYLIWYKKIKVSFKYLNNIIYVYLIIKIIKIFKRIYY